MAGQDKGLYGEKSFSLFFYLRWAEWCFFCCRGLLGLNVDVLRFFFVSKYTICCMFS